MTGKLPAIAALAAAAALTITATGCAKAGGTTTTANDAKLRNGYGRKSYSLDDVPPEQRERVKAFMRQGQTGAKPAAAAAGQKPSR